MRTDAHKNRDRLLDVTVQLVLEVGGEPARDLVAARAGLGIGTLYRHFPDRQSLLHAAARHALERCIGAGETLVDTVSNGEELVRRYMHMALESGIGAVNILHPLLEDKSWDDLSDRAARLMQTIVARAQSEAAIGADITERDLVLALIRFARPLAIGLPPAEERALAKQQLDVYLDGLGLPKWLER
jgi:AcrR family transcriptional regulator